MTDALNAYDFRQPRQLADDVEDLLDSWKASFIDLASTYWPENLTIPMQWTAGELETTRAADVVDRVATSTVIFQVTIGGDEEISWFVIPKRLALTFVMSMLGDAPDDYPEDRSLTDIEKNLLDLIAQELCAALNDAQPAGQKLTCKFGGVRKADELTRTFAANEQIVLIPFQVKKDQPQDDQETSAESDEAKSDAEDADDDSEQEAEDDLSSILWLMSNKALLRYVTHFSELRNGEAEESPELKRLVEEIPVEVVIKLGDATVHFNDLASMQVGDLLILDQRVTEPLCATVSETIKFRGWPGRVGSRQGFQITQLLTDKN